MKANPLIVQCNLHAPEETIWKALTENDQMKKWYFDIQDFKAIAGFEFNFTAGSDQKKYVHLCKVTDVIPGKKLAYTWKYKDYPGNSLVTFELSPEGDSTQIKVIHEGLETFPGTGDFSTDSFKKGWTQILCSNLKNYVENKSK